MSTDEMIDDDFPTWDYRLVRYELPSGLSRYQVCEVYFTPDGTPEWCLPHDPIEACTADADQLAQVQAELREELTLLSEALEKPVIEGSTLRAADEVLGELLAEAGVEQ